MLIDCALVFIAVISYIRGRGIGFVRQLGSTVGFFGGLLLGAWLEPHTVTIAHTPASRAVVTLLTTLGCAVIFLTLGEFAGINIKHRWLKGRAINIDNVGGSILSVISLLLTAWLTAAVIATFPSPTIQNGIRDSWIISQLDRYLPSAPRVISELSRLINPNGFPQVFVGSEPIPRGNVHIPSLGSLQTAVNRDKDSVVRIAGKGCGGIVEGSGFVVGSNLVATNAHVIAGIKHAFVEDSAGTHSSQVIWFDPDLDFAVLRVSNLAGKSLVISSQPVKSGTAAVVLGYPGGGAFTAGPAAVLTEIEASGRNIYGKGHSLRSVYEIQADIIPGNSGGPLIAKNGSVIGIIFAESTAYNHVGYALTTEPIVSAINQAVARNQIVDTGQCAK